MYRDSLIRTKRPSGPPYFEEYTDCEIYEGVIAHGCNQYFMRTASVGSNSMPMYMKSGAIPVSQQQDVSSTEQATENHTQSLQRIYLWGDCMNTISTRMNP